MHFLASLIMKVLAYFLNKILQDFLLKPTLAHMRQVQVMNMDKNMDVGDMQRGDTGKSIWWEDATSCVLESIAYTFSFYYQWKLGDVGEWLKLTSCHIAYRVSGKHIFTSTSSIKNSEDRVSRSLGKMLDLVTTVQLSNCCGALSL